jgi:hypothetical protein
MSGPPSPESENLLRSLALYAEKLILRDLRASPHPLCIVRILPFEALATDPFVMGITEGDAQLLYRALQGTQNLTLETDRIAGTMWVGAVLDGDWPTNATIVVSLPRSVGVTEKEVTDKIQKLTPQIFSRVWRVQSTKPAPTPSVSPAPEANETAPPTRENTGFLSPTSNDQFEESGPAELLDWLVGFSCGAAAENALRDLEERRFVHDGRTYSAMPRFKQTSSKQQKRIDQAFPLVTMHRPEQSRFDVAGSILRRCPEYGAPQSYRLVPPPMPPPWVFANAAAARRARSAAPARRSDGGSGRGRSVSCRVPRRPRSTDARVSPNEAKAAVAPAEATPLKEDEGPRRAMSTRRAVSQPRRVPSGPSQAQLEEALRQQPMRIDVGGRTIWHAAPGTDGSSRRESRSRSRSNADPVAPQKSAVAPAAGRRASLPNRATAPAVSRLGALHPAFATQRPPGPPAMPTGLHRGPPPLPQYATLAHLPPPPPFMLRPPPPSYEQLHGGSSRARSLARNSSTTTAFLDDHAPSEGAVPPKRTRRRRHRRSGAKGGEGNDAELALDEPSDADEPATQPASRDTAPQHPSGASFASLAPLPMNGNALRDSAVGSPAKALVKVGSPMVAAPVLFPPSMLFTSSSRPQSPVTPSPKMVGNRSFADIIRDAHQQSEAAREDLATRSPQHSSEVLYDVVEPPVTAKRPVNVVQVPPQRQKAAHSAAKAFSTVPARRR